MQDSRLRNCEHRLLFSAKSVRKSCRLPNHGQKSLTHKQMVTLLVLIGSGAKANPSSSPAVFASTLESCQAFNRAQPTPG